MVSRENGNTIISRLVKVDLGAEKGKYSAFWWLKLAQLN